MERENDASLLLPSQLTQYESSKITLQLPASFASRGDTKIAQISSKSEQQVVLQCPRACVPTGSVRTAFSYRSFAGLPFKALMSLQKEEFFLSCACNCCPLEQQQNLLQLNTYSV